MAGRSALKIDMKRNIGWFYLRRHIDPQDIDAIGAAMGAICDDVHLHAIDMDEPDRSKLRDIVSAPCVIFSQSGLPVRPPRGRFFNPKPLPKMRQAELFWKHGIPHPHAAIYRPDRKYSEDDFGPTVIVKPIQGSHGHGIFAMETRLIEEYRENLIERTNSSKFPLMIQRYIDTGDHIVHYRVLLLFGAVMFALKRSSIEKRPTQDFAEFMTDEFIQSHGVKKNTEFCREPDVIELAQRVANTISEAPIIGIDLVREAQTGEVYVIEANIGNTWQFSSESGEGFRSDVGGRDVLVKEFDSWNVAARRLSEIARLYAE